MNPDKEWNFLIFILIFSFKIKLVCNKIVALKKHQSGKIILEGVVSDDYYKIRKILYEQYAML
jgi:hypothetical protein